MPLLTSASSGPSGTKCGAEVSVVRQLRDKHNYLIFMTLTWIVALHWLKELRAEKVYITVYIILITVADCEIQSTLMFLGLLDQWTLLDGSLSVRQTGIIQRLFS